MKKIMCLLSFLILLLFLFSCGEDTNNYEKQIKDSIFNTVSLTEAQIYDMFDPIIDNQLKLHQYRNNIKLPDNELKILIISMIIHETGYLKSQLVLNNNLLGIKKLTKRPIVKLPTQEYRNGKSVTEWHEFAAFYDFEDCIMNWLTLVSVSDYYQKFRECENLSNAILEISSVYATDPGYAGKIYKYVDIIEENKKLNLKK